MAAQTEGQPAIDVESLSKEFSGGDGSVLAVDDVSFSIDHGSVVGILGPNGAGKTTMIKSILGLIEPTDGTVRVCGLDPTSDKRDIYQYVSAVLEGDRNIYWRLTVRENLRYFTGLQGMAPDATAQRQERLLSLLNLEDKADERVRNLSRGMKQKACLACVLCRETPVVFLDEPTLGLDVEAARDLRRELTRLTEEENRTVVVTSHDMDVIEAVCDRVLVFNEGRLITNKRLDALLDLFSVQSYRVDLADRYPQTSTIPGYDPDWSADRRSFEVVVDDRADFYSFVDTLQRADVPFERLTAVEPDLEDIFLSLVEDGTPETSPTSTDQTAASAVTSGGDR